MACKHASPTPPFLKKDILLFQKYNCHRTRALARKTSPGKKKKTTENEPCMVSISSRAVQRLRKQKKRQRCVFLFFFAYFCMFQAFWNNGKTLSELTCPVSLCFLSSLLCLCWNKIDTCSAKAVELWKACWESARFSKDACISPDTWWHSRLHWVAIFSQIFKVACFKCMGLYNTLSRCR